MAADEYNAFFYSLVSTVSSPARQSEINMTPTSNLQLSCSDFRLSSKSQFQPLATQLLVKNQRVYFWRLLKVK